MAYRATPKMQERKEARRRSILAAATRLFGAHGYHATTVPMIVAEASTSTGNFYLHFRNKEDVFAGALSDLGERISGAIDAAIGQAPCDSRSQMKAAVEGFVLFLAAHPEEARILIVESSGLSSALERIRRSIIASHTRGVEQGLRLLAPDMSPAAIQITARCWTGAVYEAVYSWLEGPEGERPRAEDLSAAVSRFNLRGIGADIR